jgi:hypothetical protein
MSHLVRHGKIRLETNLVKERADRILAVCTLQVRKWMLLINLTLKGISQKN